MMHDLGWGEAAPPSWAMAALGLLACVPAEEEPSRRVVDTAPPASASVTIVPSQPSAREALQCVITPPSPHHVRWTVDGVPFVGSGTTHPGDTVPAGVTDWGEHWTCTAVPDDLSARPASAEVMTSEPPGGNVLVVLLDDVGLDKVGAYGLHPSPPPTPNLDALSEAGVRFTNAYAAPVCSAARANLLTGRYGRRTGIGDTVRVGGTYELRPSEVTLPELLDVAPQRWSTSMVGKWHLSGFDTPTGVDLPNVQGFAWFSGVMGNITEMTQADGAPISYDHWEKTTNGTQRFVDRYLTTDQIDDALARVEAMPEPWLLYLPLSAPHSPLHVPPESLHTSTADFSANQKADYYDAMLEAADTELGRLLAGIGPERLARTTVIVAGDNGTPDHSIRPPWSSSRGKATLFDGGTRVPLLVTGPHIGEPGRTEPALVHLVDIWPTVADIAGVFADTVLGADGLPVVLDGHSLMPLLSSSDAAWPREYLYVERFFPNGHPPYSEIDTQAVRTHRYKLIRDGGVDRLYRYEADALDEGPDLFADVLDPEAERAYYELSRELDRLSGNLVYSQAE